MAIVSVGSKLAGYRIDALIGRGGMGVVYRGTDLRLGRPVAIKLISAERATDPIIRERFEREARLMAAIDHPNVLPVYAAGEEDGSLYLVMRFVAGTDLAALLGERGRLEPAQAVLISEQVAAALDAAHQCGLVHRDIKPANVLLAGDHTYLSDFGIGRAVEAASRLTDSNDWLGTVDFCSPEQLRGEPTDGRADVYSLGCLLHTALTGTPPHHRDSTPATMLAHLHEQPPPASRTESVPAAFDPVIARALAKRPAERYPTAGELARAARLALDGHTAVATAPSDDDRRDRGSAPRTLIARRRGAADATRRRGETRASRTRRLRGATRTKLDLRPRREARDERTPPRPHRALSAGVAAALLLAVAITAGVLALNHSKPPPPGPLSSSEIDGVVQSFSTAYGDRDSRALAPLLAPDVTRVSSEGIERGRSAVLAQYNAEFSDHSIIGYRLAALRLEPGWVGRAAGQYVVVRRGEAVLSGSVAFGVERVDGYPRIALIATQPPA